MTGIYIGPAMPWSAPVAGRVCSHVHAAYGVSWLKTLAHLDPAFHLDFQKAL